MAFLFVVRTGRTVRAVGGRAVRTVAGAAAIHRTTVRRAVEPNGAARVQVVIGVVQVTTAVMQPVADVVLQQQVLVQRRVRMVQIVRQMVVLVDGRQLLTAAVQAVQQVQAVGLVAVDHALHHVVAKRVELAEVRAELLAVAKRLAAVVVHHFRVGANGALQNQFRVGDTFDLLVERTSFETSLDHFHFKSNLD